MTGPSLTAPGADAAPASGAGIAPVSARGAGAPRLVLAALAASLLAAGCASFSGIDAPQARLREPVSLGLGTGGEAASTATAGAQWWQDFGDPELDRLVGLALRDSPSLKLAQARLTRARAVSDAATAATLPAVNGSLEITRERYSENGLIPPPLGGSVLNNGTLQASASWEIDFFGRNAAALASALGATRAAEADAQAARVLLASQVARAYFQLRRAEEQAGVAERTLAQREQQLRLVRDRVNAGLDTQLELRQSEGALPEARQQIEALREQAQLARHALAALAGDPTLNVAPPAQPMAALRAAALPAALPADLLGRRPDVAAARWRVETAGQDVAGARAQFYPNINLVAFAGLSSIGLGELLHAGSLQWGLGPALRLPLFDAGRLRANLRMKTADLDAAVESYNAAVLDAVRETADQIASLQSVARQQTEQARAQAAAESAYDIALQRYRAGLGNYLNVLAAETAVLNQRRLAVDLAARALDARVQLARALGGGYPGDAALAARDAQQDKTP